jgi:RNA polymerase sigma-70 factor, ECF subfamily
MHGTGMSTADVIRRSDLGVGALLQVGRKVRLQADPDEAAVAAAKADTAAFVVLYDRHFASVHRYVTLRVRTPAAAEDVTSQVFLIALERLDSFRGRGRFAAWLFRIAQNAVRDFHRRRRPTERAEVLEQLADPDPGPEERVLDATFADELWRELAALKSEQQHLLGLRYGAGLEIDEIASLLGKTPNAVRVGLHRALNELRKRYMP